jgi:hypothetical protein
MVGKYVVDDLIWAVSPSKSARVGVLVTILLLRSENGDERLP